LKVERVQRIIGSALAMTIATILAAGLCFLAAVADGEGAKPGLLIIAGAIGLITMVGVRILNQVSVLSPWLLLGLIPAAVGWFSLYVRG
jgi:hypothetical protein